MPINHIASYAQFLEGLLNEYKARDLLANDFKTIAGVEIEMKKIHKLVTENYALNSMKGAPCPVRKFGIVTYSDEIAIDFTKCRIMILETGLVCVRTRLSTVSNAMHQTKTFEIILIFFLLRCDCRKPKRRNTSNNYFPFRY